MILISQDVYKMLLKGTEQFKNDKTKHILSPRSKKLNAINPTVIAITMFRSNYQKARFQVSCTQRTRT